MKVQLQQDPFHYSSSSSSSQRESSPAPEKLRAKSNIGCMSGLFHLLYKYHNTNRRRFLLTFGKKQKQQQQPQPQHEEKKVLTKSQVISMGFEAEQNKKDLQGAMARLSSCDCEARSPTLPAELRRRSSKSLQVNQPPALVARLMGLELNAAELAMAEKRRRLIGALEKCDEDLKALKKIIEVVKSGSNSTSSSGGGGGDNDNDDNNSSNRRSDDCDGEKYYYLQASPVLSSVLDEFTGSAFSGYSRSRRYSNNRNIHSHNGGVSQQLKKKPGEEDVMNTICFFERINCHMNQGKSASPNLWTSKAMVESVNEVCSDISWGQRREIGRIGLALQDYIYRDLIEEIVIELMGIACIYPLPLPLPLPFESCKKRLCF